MSIDQSVPASSALELISAFANIWFSLSVYDKESFPEKGWTKKQVFFTAEELTQSLAKLKSKLIFKRQQATSLFGQEKTRSAVSGIVGNIFANLFHITKELIFKVFSIQAL